VTNQPPDNREFNPVEFWIGRLGSEPIDVEDAWESLQERISKYERGLLRSGSHHFRPPIVEES
jgi:hypothetical protein